MESKALVEPVLVGREQELQKLHHFLEVTSEGKGKTIFISAEAGIGKTRLVNEFLYSLKKQKNIVILPSWCLFNSAVPCFPFIEAFSNYYSAAGGKHEKKLGLNILLKDPADAGLMEKRGHLSPQALKDKTFVAVARALHSIAAEKLVILVVEDIHWADSASLALLHYITRAVDDSERVLVLATFRSEELTNDSEGYPHPLIETLALMRREDLFKQISLPRLSPSCIVKIAESMLKGTLQKDLADKLAVKSEGNPLFVVDSLRLLYEQGKLIQKNSEWSLVVKEIEIPSKFSDIITQRLACLNNSQRRVLDTASVIGDDFEVGLLSAVLDLDSLDVLETLNVIAHSTSLVYADENQFRFDHARSREIIYDSLAKPLKQAYHNKIAEKIECSKSVKLPLSKLAYHYARAGNKKKAIKYALATGKNELAKWSNAQAIEHFQYVVQNTLGDAEEMKVALEGLGDAYAANSMYTEAIKMFDKLALLGTGALRLRALRKASDASFHKWDNPELLMDYAKKAEDLADYDRLEMARIISNRGRAWGAFGKNGKHNLDYADFKAALDVFEEENSIADVGEALWRVGITGKQGGESDVSRLNKHLRSVAIFKFLGDLRKETEATLYLGFHLFSTGLFSEARNALSRVLETGEKLGLFPEMAMACHWMSMIEEVEDKTEEAIFQCFRAQEYEKRTDSQFARGFPSALTRLYAKLGHMKKADEFFEKTIKPFPEDFALNNPFFFVHLSKGVYFAAKGLHEESNCAFKKYEQSLRQPYGEPEHEMHYRINYAWALERQSRFAKATAQRDKARMFSKQVEERFDHASIQLSALMPRQNKVDEKFEVRLDMVNVSKTHNFLVKLDGLIPSYARVVSQPSSFSINNNSIDMKTKKIEPFEVATIRLSMAFTKSGSYNFQPRLTFMTSHHEIKTSEAKPITLTVSPQDPNEELQRIEQTQHPPLVFESNYSWKAFNFLVSAFREDYYKRKLPREESGWRTLMEVVRNGQVSMNSMYGRSGRGGKAKLELAAAGLVETRFFSGERGRGGSIQKMRILYEHKTVTKLVDKRGYVKEVT